MGTGKTKADELKDQIANSGDSSMSIDDEFVSPTGDLGADDDDTENGASRSRKLGLELL